MTIRQVNQEHEPVKSFEIAPGGKYHISTSDLQVRPAAVIEKVCGIYHRVRPIVIFLGEFWLVPKKWRESLKQFSTLMDSLCPSV